MVRKRGSKAQSSGKKPRGVKRDDARIQKWDKRGDIPMDAEDQFQDSRDKILLNDDEVDEDLDEEDVYALTGLSDDDDDVAEDEDEDAMDVDDASTSKKSQKKKTKGKGKGKRADSDESDESSEEEEGWGQSRAAYYSSNAAQLESDDEEGNELEEQEAKRLQTKMRQAMSDADFGFNDPIDLTSSVDEDAFLDFAAPTVQQLPQDDAALIRHFEKTDPESLALARDWTDTAYSLTKTKKHIEAASPATLDGVKMGLLHLYYQALLTYASTLAFYMHLRSTEKHAQHPEVLRAHPIMSRLLTLKQSLVTMEGLDFGNSDSEEEHSDEEDELDDDELLDDAEALWEHSDLEDNELTGLLEDAELSDVPKIRIKPLQAPMLASTRPKKKRKTNSGESAPSVVFDLVEPEFTSASKPSSSQTTLDAADGFGEATELQYADAADKKARKKTLRFHTSKIESASARRRGARSDAAGGDDDIPYRERKRAKDVRLEEEAQKRLAKQGGADLDAVDPEAGDMDVDGGGDVVEDAEGYYDLVKKQKKEKKEKRQAEHEVLSARVDYDDADASGPRAPTRAILKNKGLTPHRPKSVRNPRVKKRQKFDQAKKKISSQKAVYKGGDGGKYEGEKSGISKVVKSVRLG